MSFNRVGQQFGNYRLVQLLGQGGFADVYLGEHLYLKTQAALKILQIRLEKDTLEDFLKEAQTIVRLDHPHIVRVLECGVENQVPFLVMQYASGGSLRQRYPKGSRLSFEELLRYVRQVAGALQYAHDRRLIHRDIKPENILLGQNNDVLLSDFGLVAMVHSTGSQTAKEMGGTIPYMAPEQLQGKPRPASDQYGLGIVVYEWLSGERPFQGSLVEIASQHLIAQPPPLYGRIAGISPAVEHAVFTALAKDPTQRFAKVLAFADALEQAYQVGQARPLNLSSNSPSPGQSSQSTFVRVLPGPSFQSTAIVTPPNVSTQGNVSSLQTSLDPSQLSQSSQPTYLIEPENPSQQPTVRRDQVAGQVLTPSNLKNTQPDLLPSGQITPVSKQVSLPVPVRRHASSWPIASLVGTILLILMVLLSFLFIPGLLRGSGIGRTTPTPSAPLISLSPQAAKNVPTSIPTRASAGIPNQAPSAIPTAIPTQVPTLSPSPSPTLSPSPSPSPTPSPSPSPTVLPAPSQVSPADGTVFNNYPRTTTLVWDTVAGAASYTVQIYYYPPGDTTCSGGSPDGTATGITGTSYTFDFVGAQPGCWQVWAVGSSGQQGSKSPLWEFRYTQ